ncbi:MAG: monovalent cation/H+ antiporter subunit D family protein [Micrococcus sp.]|nr:monovalent cation/H+ antiporter subunit D family protein [Micrococcus sp.]
MVTDVVHQLLALFVAVPLVTAGALVLVGLRLRIHRAVMMLVLTASMVSGGLLIAATRDGQALGGGVGPWEPGIAIPFVADMFTALMLTVTGFLSLVSAMFAYSSRVTNSLYFAPLLLVLTAGVNGALLTADLFNLFVFIEVMLLPSYGLYVLSANRREPLRRVDGARLYVTLNLLTSTILLSAVGLMYGVTGSVNLAVLAGAAQDDPRVALIGGVILFAISIKAAIVPVHGWLARTYPSTSPAVTALFSGLHTKVAIFAIYRIYAVLFDGDARFLWVGVAVFSATMLIGVLGAVGETTTRSILVFHMVSQIGYIVLGVALFTELGLAAGIFYLIHHMVVKASLFFSTGAVEVRYGSGRIGDLQGVAKREPILAIAFFIAALSLAGIPPFSGFVAKFTLIVAAVEAGQIAAVVVMILVSLVTLLSMLKIWNGVFWGEPRNPAQHEQALATAAMPRVTTQQPAASPSAASDTGQQWTQPAPPTGVLPVVFDKNEDLTSSRVSWALSAPAVITAAVTVFFGLGAQVLWGFAEVAAAGLLDTSAYVEAVLGR